MAPGLSSRINTIQLEDFRLRSAPTSYSRLEPATSEAVAGEPTKVAISSDRWIALAACMIQLVPIAITVFILVLCFETTYWQDSGKPYQKTILDTLQFVAKGHELLMGAALSAIVLYKIRSDLCRSRGVPFGLVTLGYQLTPDSLFSSAFLGGTIAKSKQRHWLLLSLLLVSAVVLSAIVGPSSAVLLIPSPAWWDVSNPFPGTQETVILPFNSSTLWPARVTLQNYPIDCTYSSYDEANSDSYETEAMAMCPQAGNSAVQDWIKSYMNDKTAPNLTVSNPGAVYRYVSTSYNGSTDLGYSVSSSISSRPARDIGSFWEYVTINNLNPANMGRPLFRPILPDGMVMKKPLVQMECAVYYKNVSASDMVFPHQSLLTPPLDQFVNERWPVPEQYLTLTTPSSDAAYFAPVEFTWVDISGNTGAPSLGAIANIPTIQQPGAIVACTVDARWAPVQIWLNPKNDLVVLQDSPDPVTLLLPPANLTELEQIYIGKGWADMLNIPSNVQTEYSEYAYGENLTVIQNLLGSWGFSDDGWVVVPPGGPETIPWAFATTLGLYLADALSRVNSISNEFRTDPRDTWIKHVDLKNASNTATLDLYDLDVGGAHPKDFEGDFPYFKTHPEYFTVFYYHVSRFGYGWGFTGTPAKLSAVVLITHAIFALSQVAVVLVKGRTPRSWQSMGELLALALNSQPSDRLQNTSAGIEKRDTWKENVRIREVIGNRLEFVLDGVPMDGMGRQPEIDKLYS